MSIVLGTNIQSLIGQKSLTNVTDRLNKTMEQMSTGYKVNSAKDDAAGFGISEQISSKIRGNSRAMANIQDGNNMLAVGEGSLEVITDNVQRIRELCVQAASEVYDKESRQAILNEIYQRLATIDNVAETTEFNGKKLLDGSSQSICIQIGPNGDTTADDLLNAIDVAPALSNNHTSAPGLDISLKITSLGVTPPAGYVNGDTWATDDIRTYINHLDTALTKLTRNKSKLGAFMNRLDSTADNLTNININLNTSLSAIKDVDIAEASSDMVRYQILQQSTAICLSQSNQMPSIALQLLQ